MKIIFDSNIYFSAFVFDRTVLKLLDYCYTEYTVYLSPEILIEIGDILKRDKIKKLMSGYNVAVVDNYLARLFTQSNQLHQYN